MSARPTRTPPRALSEADELDLYLEERDTWLSTEVRNSACQIRSDAPWIQFLDARYRLLLAYQAAERAWQPDEPDSTLDPLRKSFLHLTRGLDRITTPIEYWSDRPHEALEGEGRHARLVKGLDELAAALAMCGCSRIGSAALAQLIMTRYTLIAARYARPCRTEPLVALDQPHSASRCRFVSDREIGSLRPQELSKYVRRDAHALDLTLERQSSQPFRLNTTPSKRSPEGKMAIQVSLLSLPDEVIRMIFCRLGSYWRQGVVPITLVCRRLRYLADEFVYQEIRSSDISKDFFPRLAAIFASRQGLRQHVKACDLPGQSRSTVYRTRGPATIPSISITTSDLLAILPLPACTSFHLQQFLPETLDTFVRVTAPLMSTLMPLVESLSLHSARSSAATNRTIASPNWWPYLARWPALQNLSIRIDSLAWPAAGSSFEALQCLNLDANLLTPFLAPASALFPNLRNLTLGGCNRNNHVQYILSTASPKLTNLCLDGLKANVAAELYVGSFPQLTVLRLCPGFSRQRLQPLLATSRIQHLAFASDCRITDKFLRALLKGPSRMTNLESLELNHVEATGGGTLYVELMEGGLMTDANKVRTDEQDMRAEFGPDWPQGCGADGLRAIVKLASSAGVALSGSAVRCRAWAWDDDFDEQYERYLVRSALEGNKFDALIEFYGFDEAGEALVRHSPVLADLVSATLRNRSSGSSGSSADSAGVALRRI